MAQHMADKDVLAGLKRQRFVISMLLVVTAVDFSNFESLDSDSKPLKFLIEMSMQELDEP